MLAAAGGWARWKLPAENLIQVSLGGGTDGDKGTIKRTVPCRLPGAELAGDEPEVKPRHFDLQPSSLQP